MVVINTLIVLVLRLFRFHSSHHQPELLSQFSVDIFHDILLSNLVQLISLAPSAN